MSTCTQHAQPGHSSGRHYKDIDTRLQWFDVSLKAWPGSSGTDASCACEDDLSMPASNEQLKRGGSGSCIVSCDMHLTTEREPKLTTHLTEPFQNVHDHFHTLFA